MVDVKICGLKSPDIVRACAVSGADWIGLNLVPESPRNILGEGKGGSDLLYDLLFAAAEVHLRTVALVANPDARTLRILSGAVMPDVIQFHGQETPDQIAEFRGMFPPSIEIWKAIGVGEKADLEAVEHYTAADRLLLDAKPPKGADAAGGHGEPFDWAILKDWQAPKPWFLAGGLTPENVSLAIAATGTSGVDVSSGVERTRGVKDAALIEQFIKAAKGA